MKNSTRLQFFGAMLAGTLAMAVQAQPFMTLKWDLNQIDVTIARTAGAGGHVLKTDGTDVGSFDGTLSFSTGANGAFAGPVSGNNTGLGGSFPAGNAGDPGTLTGVSGTLTFASGILTSGDFHFENTLSDTFTTDIRTGAVLSFNPFAFGGDGGYEVDGLTLSGLFFDAGADSLFGAVDITKFLAAGAAHGVFKEFVIHSGATTSASDVDLTITIPLPGGAAMASLGLFGLVSRRRR